MFPSSSGGSGDDCRSDRTEIKIKKLISTAEKFKNKYSLGEQVNKELMKRCEQLKVDIGVSNQKLEAVSAALESLCVDGDLPDPLLRAIEDMRLIIDPQFRLGLEHRDSHHNAGDGSRGRARSVFLNNTEGTSLIRRSNADDAPDDLAFDDSRSSSAVGESACRPGADDADGEAPAASRRASARISIGSTGAEGIGSKKSAPLFEHFLVVGAVPEAADEYAAKLHAHEVNSSSYWRRFTSYMSSSGSSSSAASTGHYSTHSEYNDSSFSGAAKSPAASTSSVFASGRASMTASPSHPSSSSSSSGAVASDSPRSSSCDKVGLVTAYSETNGFPCATHPTLLFRFPEDVDPPPPELFDFCLPTGGRLERLSSNYHEDSNIQEVLYGQGQSKRTSRCFIFLVEDKTLEAGVADDEAGEDTGRLYGVCVTHPRLLRGTCKNLLYKDDKARNGKSRRTSHGKTEDGKEHEPYLSCEFESAVCFCFITRFPLFDFFFSVIFDLITCERLVRMETIAAVPPESILDYPTFVRDMYRYLPSELLQDVLSRLTVVRPPRFGESLRFQLNESMAAIAKARPFPPYPVPEYHVAAASWALPILLSWLTPETLVRVLGMIMAEAKVIVIGTEPGIVSCAVMGLLSLLQPLSWVAPLIPILPIKNVDFVESPVPILAGLVVDENIHKGTSSASDILRRINNSTFSSSSVFSVDDAVSGSACGDNSDGDSLVAVLDVSEKEVFIASKHRRFLKDLLIPGSEALIGRIRECLAHHSEAKRSVGAAGSKVPLYLSSQTPLSDTQVVQDAISGHITAVVAMCENRPDLLEQAVGRELNQSFSTELYGPDIEATSPTRASGTSSGRASLALAKSPSMNPVTNPPAAARDQMSSRFSVFIGNGGHTASIASGSKIKKLLSPAKEEVVRASKESLEEGKYDSFLRRFVQTQMYNEYADNLYRFGGEADASDTDSQSAAGTSTNTETAGAQPEDGGAASSSSMMVVGNVGLFISCAKTRAERGKGRASASFDSAGLASLAEAIEATK